MGDMQKLDIQIIAKNRSNLEALDEKVMCFILNKHLSVVW